jgi:hypothetical protein
LNTAKAQAISIINACRAMKQGIKIKVIREPDDDGLYKYQINLSNGHTFASLDFYGYGDNFKQFGEGLLNFPKGTKDIVAYELGEDKTNGQMKWAYYMLLKYFALPHQDNQQ